MSGNSWVTLATNDSYSLGALVLARSLRRVSTIHNLTVMITPGVSAAMRNQLASIFNVVEEVNILDSKDEKNLALLTRPDLGITFTKLHCWRLIQFSKCVFLDADILVLQNCDELFEREELSAAPDVGWPDCFNSGVFVYRPSIETYNALINFALSQGSFDGGDQGLLNQFFSDWATKDISRHLPFIYNMCSTATYSYLPAFKQFGQNVKIVHFIGSAKPWLQYLESETREVRPTSGSEHLQGLLQLWWDIFCNDVHSTLSSEMAGLAGALSQLTLGVARSPEQIALEEHLRKQAWEHGNIDYMGRDSFDNIWRKICQTLAEAPSADSLLEQSEPPSQVSGVVVETISKEVTPADVTPPSLPESHSVASAPKESNGAALSSTVAGHLSKTSDISTECPSTDAVSGPDLTNTSSTSEVQADLPSLPTLATNISDLESVSSALTSPELQNSSDDCKLVSQSKETVSSSAVGISTESSPEFVQPVISQAVVIAQKDELQLSTTVSESNLGVNSGEKHESQEAQVSVSISLQDVSLTENVSSQELLKAQSKTVDTHGSDVAAARSVTSIASKEVSDSNEELKDPELNVPLEIKETIAVSVDSHLTLITSEPQHEPETQSAQVVANVATPLTESSARVDTVSTDPKSAIDLSRQSIISTMQSTTASSLDPSIDTQKVTVTAPTPPTSPTDSSTVVPPAPFASATLSIEPSIPPTPPVGSEHPSTDAAPSSGSVSASLPACSELSGTEAAQSSGPVSTSLPVGSELPSAEATPASVPASTPPALESQGLPETSSQAADPKAPIPPKRRHKPSQNPDQSGSKLGKAPTKSSKGKK